MATAQRHNNRPIAPSGRTPHVTAIEARAHLDELIVARKSHTVTFHEVARAWFDIHDVEHYNSHQREEFEREFPKLLNQFADDRGGIESSYFCEHIRVAAALTDIELAAHLPPRARRRAAAARSAARPPEHAPTHEDSSERPAETTAPGVEARQRAHIFAIRRHGSAPDLARKRFGGASASAIHLEAALGHPDQWQSKDLLFDCLELHYRALEFLRPKHRKICLRRVFAIIGAALGTLDARGAESRSHAEGTDPNRVALKPEELGCLRRELCDTEVYFKRHADGRSQMSYFLGMLVGVGLIMAGWGLTLIWVKPTEPLALTMLAGGIGAVVSVMIRLTRRSLTLDPEAGTPMTMLLGFFRPLTGAVFGTLLYVLMKGGVVTLRSNIPSGTEGTMYYAGLAFVAGFSERFAQVVVHSGSEAIGAAQGEGRSVERTAGFDADSPSGPHPVAERVDGRRSSAAPAS